jgi:cell division protein FtsQ
MDPRMGRRRADVSRRAGRWRRYALGAGAATVVLVVIGWFLLHSGLASARVITVRGAPAGTAPAVIGAAGLGGHPPLVDIPVEQAVAAVERLPWVGRATVERSWPDGVVVTVTRRVPVAVMADAGAGWAEVDRTGRVVAVVPTAPAGLVQLHVDAQPGRLGEWVPAGIGPEVKVAATLPPAFVAQVVTVEAQPDAAVALQLTTPVSVLLGTADDLAAKYDDVATILLHATLHPGDVIDVRVPGSPVISGP